jgi:hypothetical protein
MSEEILTGRNVNGSYTKEGVDFPVYSRFQQSKFAWMVYAVGPVSYYTRYPGATFYRTKAEAEQQAESMGASDSDARIITRRVRLAISKWDTMDASQRLAWLKDNPDGFKEKPAPAVVSPIEHILSGHSTFASRTERNFRMDDLGRVVPFRQADIDRPYSRPGRKQQ